MSLELMMRASGRPRLFELLREAVGEVIADRFEIVAPFASGAQSHVFLARDRRTHCEVIVKQAAFDYSRPLSVGRNQVASARERLRREHGLLVRSPTHHMPRPIALAFGAPIVKSARASSVFGGPELYLVEEKIEGSTLGECALAIWPRLTSEERERQAAHVAREFILFSGHLLRAGWFYPDVSAQNLIVKPSGVLRVVDAGSAVEREDDVALREFTPAFTTPVLLQKLYAGARIPATLSTTLPLLAKLLHFALTRSEPLDGRLPDLELLRIAGYSYACTRAIEAMLDLDANPDSIERAELLLEEWDAWPEI
jgi:serine/threonine protein kinase